MGILRADRVSGLGGANAINGSVNFGGDLGTNGNYLAVSDSDDFNFGSGDFTIECWVYANAVSSGGYEGIIGQWPQSGANALNSWVLEVVGGDLEFYYCYSGASLGSVVQGATLTAGQWNHVMVTRSGNTMYMFYNGDLTGSGTSVTATFNDVSADVTIGGYINSTAMWNGNISNLRIIKGRALYTAAFTPPSTRLTKTSDTVLLCCQSPGDIIQEETGKIITPKKSAIGSSFPVASRKSPDKGEDYGTTFTDNTKFDTLSYMVPPGGTTAESNRGRGLMMGGGGSPGSQWSGYTNLIDYVEIQSTGIAKDFGDLTSSPLLGANGGAFSSTRGTQAGGFAPSSSNIIDYVTIATTSNALDFGDLTNMKSGTAALSNQTRGIFAGGDPSGGAYVNSIDYITIATTGDSATFGDLTTATRYAIGFASPTRGIVAGGAAPGAVNTIEYVTIASTGDATNFGDMTYTGISPFGVASSTRGIIAGSSTEPNQNYNTIDYLTIATTGNTSDFGDLTVGKGQGASMSNSIRGLFGRGEYNVASRYYTNAIDSITIATIGNAQDFGDSLSTTTASGGGADSHGGIS